MFRQILLGAVIGLCSFAAQADDAVECRKMNGDSSIRACTAMIHVDKDNPIWYYFRSHNYDVSKNSSLVIKDLQKSLNLDKKSSEAMVMIGVNYFMLQKYETTVIFMQKAINSGFQKDSKYTKSTQVKSELLQHFAYLYLGKSYEKLGSLDKAIDVYSAGDHSFPDAGGFFVPRASVHEKLGNIPAAVADLRKALKIDPANKEAQENLRRLTGR